MVHLLEEAEDPSPIVSPSAAVASRDEDEDENEDEDDDDTAYESVTVPLSLGDEAEAGLSQGGGTGDGASEEREEGGVSREPPIGAAITFFRPRRRSRRGGGDDPKDAAVGEGACYTHLGDANRPDFAGLLEESVSGGSSPEDSDEEEEEEEDDDDGGAGDRVRELGGSDDDGGLEGAPLRPGRHRHFHRHGHHPGARGVPRGQHRHRGGGDPLGNFLLSVRELWSQHAHSVRDLLDNQAHRQQERRRRQLELERGGGGAGRYRDHEQDFEDRRGYSALNTVPSADSLLDGDVDHDGNNLRGAARAASVANSIRAAAGSPVGGQALEGQGTKYADAMLRMVEWERGKWREERQRWRDRVDELKEEVVRLRKELSDEGENHEEKFSRDNDESEAETDDKEDEDEENIGVKEGILIDLLVPDENQKVEEGRKDAGQPSEEAALLDLSSPGQDSRMALAPELEKAPPKLVAELSPDQVVRYSRQLLLSDGFGVRGQIKLLNSSVLVIGAGGIGSSLLLYLAASGVGHITVVDHDCVEVSNLHRQVIHTTGAASAESGTKKAISACNAMKALNPTIQCTPVTEVLTHSNALELVRKHDVVVDASDNPRTRYLLSDACVLADKVLVSGSAMGTEGQLTVYNNQRTSGDDAESGSVKKRSGCYRCLYPKINPAEGCKSCSDNGVLGTVPGLIGVLQATEALKVLTGVGGAMDDRLLMYDSLGCSFLSIKKPPRRKNCAACGDEPTIRTMEDSARDAGLARGPSGAPAPSLDEEDKEGDGGDPAYAPAGLLVTNLPPELSVSPSEYHTVRLSGTPHILLDVRVKRQFDMCALPGSINIPLAELESSLDRIEELSGGEKVVYCVCRRGVASAEAVRVLDEVLRSKVRNDGSDADGEGMRYPGINSVRNISGGLNAWSDEVDPAFPRY